MKKIALLLALLMLVFGCVGCSEEEKVEGTQAATGTAPTEQQDDVQTGEELETEDCPESEDGKHQYEEELISEATCTVNGTMLYSCVLCQRSVTKEIPAHGHDGTGASCEEPSVCTICFEVAEEAWGHDGEGGICKNCGIDMIQQPDVTTENIPEETVAEEVEPTVESTEA